MKHDSTPTVQTPAPVPTNPGGTTQQQHPNPTPTNPGTRQNTSSGAHDAVRIGSELDTQFDQIMDGSEATRLRLATRAMEIYGYSDLPIGVRAQAAANAGQAYLEVATAALAAGEAAKEATNRQLGTDWMRKAARLDPKYERNLQGPPQ